MNNDQRIRRLTAVGALYLREIEDTSIEGRRHLVARLERICLAEYRRKLEGHWAYNCNRHRNCLVALSAERFELDGILEERVAA